MLKLLNRRAKLSSAIGQCKLASGSHVYAPDREEHLLRKLEGKNRGPLSRSALRSIYREILSTSRAVQSPLKIACLGRELSDSWVATRRRFGSSDRYQPAASLQQVFKGLAKRTLDVGVVDRESLVDFLWRRRRELPPSVSVCGDIRLQRDADTQDVYYLLSRQPVPQTPLNKTVILIESVSAYKTVKDWRSAFSVLDRKTLHVERTAWPTNRSQKRWLVEIKGHWEHNALAILLKPHHSMIRRWFVLGRYPEVPNYA